MGGDGVRVPLVLTSGTDKFQGEGREKGGRKDSLDAANKNLSFLFRATHPDSSPLFCSNSALSTLELYTSKTWSSAGQRRALDSIAGHSGQDT